MAALAPPVAAVRAAVRRAVQDLGRGGESPAPLLLVAGSGGADSLALAVAAGFVAPRAGWRAGLLTVDHRLQPGSGERARALAEWAEQAGLSPVEVLPVSVTGRPGGPEAAARSARYAALASAAGRLGAAAVLLGHTRDDQAETVLLALARGAGPRGLAGMPPRHDRAGVAWLRPLLGVARAETAAACRALGLVPWQDPHNVDPAYARARVRARALPALVDALGERVVDNLARTARQLAADTAALDGWAGAVLDRASAGPATGAGSVASAGSEPGAGPALVIAELRELPEAVRSRVLHGWARRLGCPGSALSHRHVGALDALVTNWRGQGPAHLPGGITVGRSGGTLLASFPVA